jgi:peptide subunit release factor 1 (eRF1)
MTTAAANELNVSDLDVSDALARLRLRPVSADHVLSVYLETTPSRLRSRAHLVAFRDCSRATRQALANTDKSAFEECVRRAERYLTDDLTPHQAGVALFVDGGEVIVVRLPEAPPDTASWSEDAEIAPLQAMLDNNERMAVVLFDAQRTRLFTIFLGEIETQCSFGDPVPGKQATGGWFALEQARFERHRLDHLRKHAQRTVRELMDVLRHRSFDRLLLAGPDEPLAVLRRQLSRPLELRLSGTVGLDMSAADADVLKVSLATAENLERQEEQDLVNELLESATAACVVLGVPSTLSALADASVHLLVMCEDFAESGAVCGVCERLVQNGSRCPACGGTLAPLASLREAMIRQALAQGARVTTVAGAAARLLRGHGSVAAWTRF